jgi:hypothetical protein
MPPLRPKLQTAGVSFFHQAQIELALRNYKTKALKNTYIICFKNINYLVTVLFTSVCLLSKIKLIPLCKKWSKCRLENFCLNNDLWLPFRYID